MLRRQTLRRPFRPTFRGEDGELGAPQADRDRGGRLLDRKLAQAGGDALDRCVAIIGSKGFADLREIDEMDVGQRDVTAPSRVASIASASRSDRQGAVRHSGRGS